MLVKRTVASHFIAGDVAIGLMLAGLALVMGQHCIKLVEANAVLVVMTLVTIAGAIIVVSLGSVKDEDGGQKTASSQ